MIKKTIKYTDYNGLEREEDFYFNLSEAEIAQMELGTSGGYTEYLKKITAAKDVPSLSKLFKEIIMKAYGVKSEDGRRFIKNDQVRADFEQTEAFSKLYMEFITDDKKAAEFMNGILPANIQQRALEEEAKKSLEQAFLEVVK